MKEMGYLTMADMEEPGFDPSLYIWGLTRAQQFTTQIGDDVRLARAAAGTVLLTPTDGFACKSDLMGAFVGPDLPGGVVGLSLQGGRVSRASGVRVAPPDGEVSPVSSRSAGATAAAAVPPAWTDSASVLSSRERSWFVLGGRDAATNRSLWQHVIDDGSWHELQITGVPPESVLAAVFRGEDRSFYVLDEVRIGPLTMARLIQISLDSLKGSIVGMWPRLKRFDKTFLSVTEDGGLLLAVSGGPGANGKSWFTKLRIGPHNIEVAWARQERGRLEAVPVESAAGLTARYEDGVGRFISAGDLAPRGRCSHDLGDCF